jgi:predicted Zn-dependent peptidase
VQPGRTPAEAEKALIAEFDKLKSGGVTPHELQRAQNQFARDYILGRESDEDKGNFLAHAAVIHNDITTADNEFDIFMNTMVSDVQRVARTYFNPTNRVVLHVVPKGAGR